MTDPDSMERFTSLYDKHYPRVYSYAVSRAGREVADEVVSDVFLIAWRRLGEVPDHALPWLLVVARNVIANQVRAAARRESLEAELRSWHSGTAPDIADQVAERQAVLRALTALSDDDRELLTLVAWHGLSPREAAQVVGCSTATYFVRLHRARRRLEQAVSADITEVLFEQRKWYEHQALWSGPQQAQSPSYVRQQIAAGHFTVAGTAEIDGRQAVKLIIHEPADPGVQTHGTLWVDATTYLPVRSVVTSVGTTPGHQLDLTTVNDMTYLAPTAANLAKTQVSIPAGFTRESLP